jgi:hypothetical protein
MKIVKIPLSNLKLATENVRYHTDEQLIELKRSLQMFGQYRPIVIDEEQTILVGNGLVMAMQQLDWQQAEVLVMEGLSSNHKKKLMLADNRLYDLGLDANQTIADFIKEIGQDDDGIPGFSQDMIQMFTSTATELTNEVLNNYGKVDKKYLADMSKVQQEAIECPQCGYTITL